MTVEAMDKLIDLLQWQASDFFAAALGKSIGQHIMDKYVRLEYNFVRLWGYLDSTTKRQLIDYVNEVMNEEK